jgi:OOP family OmpA-OmpF porin
MKNRLLLLAFLIFSAITHAQVLKRLAARAKNKLEQKAGDKVDNVIDSTLDGSGKKAPDKNANSNNNTNNANTTGNNTNSNGNSTDEKVPASDAVSNKFKYYSKFDFIPGDKVVAFENFSQDATGDFPDKWNTNSTAEVVNVDGHEGKWLAMAKTGVFMPEFFTSFPDNFTLQFDLACNPEFSYYTSGLDMNFVSLAKPQNFTDWRVYYAEGRNGFLFNFHPTSAGGNDGETGFEIYENGTKSMFNNTATTQFHAKTKNFASVSVWRQKQRIRVYINEEKVLDLPKGMTLPAYNALVFTTGGFQQPQDRFLITNIKLAVGAPDTRNKLITEGKFVTKGILFDVNSDKIKPESYGTLKDIASVLKDNPGVKVMIIGHTDSDGDAAKNLDLSRRRAESVKSNLTTEFGIERDRMQTDGKGSTQPLDTNNTPEGKANNRRVEFIKQ